MQLRWTLLRSVVAIVASTVAPSRVIGAQSPQVTLSAGMVVPAAAFRPLYASGPAAQASFFFGHSGSRTRLRADLESAWLVGRNKTSPPNSPVASLQVMSAIASLVIAAPRPGVSPYFSTGVAVQRLTRANDTNPYGTTFGLRAGGGVRWRARRLCLQLEVTPHLTLTDYGSAQDFAAGAYIPIFFGLGF